MLFKLSHLNSNLPLTLGYRNRALNNSAQVPSWRPRALFESRNILDHTNTITFQLGENLLVSISRRIFKQL